MNPLSAIPLVQWCRTLCLWAAPCFCISATWAQTFTEVSLQSGINDLIHTPTMIGGGCAFFDYNNDGWLDIYISGGLGRDKLYRNNQNGTFTERGWQAGLAVTGLYYTMGVVTGDIDNDGYRDLFVTTLGIGDSYHSHVPNILFRNNRNGTFTDISAQAGIRDSAWSMAATMGDYNLDGFLDIYVANYVKSIRFIHDSVTTEVIGFAHTGFANFFYMNNGNGTFTNIAPQLQVDDAGTGLAAAFSDYDNDRDMDIFLVNDFGAWVVPNKLYRNEFPANAFTEVSASSGADAAIYGMGIAIGDYDQDDDLDYYITNIGENVFYRNNGNGTFTDVARQAGVENGYVDSLFTTGWGTAFLDYDHDTWLDLFVSNGHIMAADFIATSEKDPKKLYRNNADGTFTDVTFLEGVGDSSIGRGFAMGDYDNDGDLDMLVTVITENMGSGNNAHALLFRNDIANGNHWLKVSVQGTYSNRDGFGSRVEAYAHGRKWIREIDGGSSHASQHSTTAHFGLGSLTRVDSVVVLWPAGGRSRIANIAADQLLTIIESGTAQVVTQRFIEICAGDSVFAAGAFQHSSGTYYDTLFLPTGIDSIIITHLTVFPLKTATLQFSICAGDSIFLGGSYQTASTVLYDTLQTANGCDSIIISELTVMPLQIVIADALLCAGDSIFAAGAWQTVSGSYFDTFPSSPCDYVVITSVYFQPPVPVDTTELFFCAGDSFFAAGAWHHTEGFYPDTFPAGIGCDTVVVTHAVRRPSFAVSAAEVICAGDSVFVGGAFQHTAGMYYNHFTASNGCDSIVMTDLRVIAASAHEDTAVIAAGDSIYLGGRWQTEAGIYADTLRSVSGCDSIVVTNLIVITGIHGDAIKESSLSVHPNPSVSDFIIRYSIPEPDEVELKIVSPAGTSAWLSRGWKGEGMHEVKVPGNSISSGAYIIIMTSSRFHQIGRAVILPNR